MSQDTHFGDDSAVGLRFERFKFSEDEQNKKKRIVFIDRKVLKDRVHYKDGYGYMRCLAPDNCPACAAGMSASDRFGTIVLEYYTDLDGNVSKPFGYTVKAFVFGNGKGNGTFSLLHGFYKAMGDKMYVRDFVVSCTNPKYQTLTFIPLETCHLLDLKTNNPQAFSEVKEDYTQKMQEMDILKVVAPLVDAATMQQVVDGKIVRRSTKNQPPAAVAAAAPATQQVQGATVVPPVTNFAGSAQPAAAASSKVDEARKQMDELSL